MIDSFYSLFGRFDNTYFNMIVFACCVLCILFFIFSFLSIVANLFKK